MVRIAMPPLVVYAAVLSLARSGYCAAECGSFRRLIDPRNGETFYIGKGKENRVFDHARGEPAAGEDELDDKLQRIREIRVDGFEVAHVIRRHGLATETLAFEVEAALIDAYRTCNLPRLTRTLHL